MRMYAYVCVCTRMYAYVCVCTRMYAYVCVCGSLLSSAQIRAAESCKALSAERKRHGGELEKMVAAKRRELEAVRSKSASLQEEAARSILKLKEERDSIEDRIRTMSATFRKYVGELQGKMNNKVKALKSEWAEAAKKRQQILKKEIALLKKDGARGAAANKELQSRIETYEARVAELQEELGRNMANYEKNVQQLQQELQNRCVC
eukprot:GHVU01053970.1.p1 GENE.GHVU01053970.1~~GHVU01053970.1.p1  ORF type:complete len:206 (+),score=40.09 GHVU01053970.1:557-1174(+)